MIDSLFHSMSNLTMKFYNPIDISVVHTIYIFAKNAIWSIGKSKVLSWKHNNKVVLYFAVCSFEIFMFIVPPNYHLADLCKLTEW